MADEDIIDLSEDISELWDFLPLNNPDTYPSKLLLSCFARKDLEFFNNAALNITHFYHYILHILLCRLYLANDKNLELLAYIQKTKEVFSGKDRRRNVIISPETVNTNLFIEIERDAINYFFHILKFDKSQREVEINQKIIDIRNSVAHLNYIPLTQEGFMQLKENILHNLNFLFPKIYKATNLKNIISSEFKQRFKTTSSYDESLLAIEEMNAKHYLTKFDYILMVKNKLFVDVKPNSYKKHLQKYIESSLGYSISEEDAA